MIRARTETKKTACNRDCPDVCSIVATVEDGRVTKLAGDHDDPITRGFLCERTNQFLHRQYSADRLTTPLLRKDGKLTAVSWDEALDFTARRLLAIRAESGPGAILNYRSGGSLGLLKSMVDEVFELFGPVAKKVGDICNGSGEAAQEADFGVSESSAIEDILNSKLIVLWGKNPHTSGPHLLPILRQAKERGITIVGFDPVRTKAATLCDHFLTPQPGGDYALAMGLARYLFDTGGIDPAVESYTENFAAYRRLVHDAGVSEWAIEADVPADEIKRIGELFLRSRPVSIQIGWGMARRRNGGAIVRAIDALAAVSGNIGVPGGGASYYYGRRTAFDRILPGKALPPARTFIEPLLGEEILRADPPLRALIVTAGNPVTMLPDSEVVRRAVRGLELSIVIDTHPTDTTDVATVVLPTLTLLEDSDLLGAYGNHYLRVSEPVTAPPEGPRHEVAILQDLADRLGVGAPLKGALDDMKRRMMGRLEAAGVTLDRLKAGPVKNPFAAPVLFAGRIFPTPSKKARLMTVHAKPPIRLRPDMPLLLMAASTPKSQSSQWSVDPGPGLPEVRVHPRSAAGIASGDAAVIESARGRLEVIVVHDAAVRPDIALMAKGGMLRQGRCANGIVAATLTDLGQGCAYYDEPVRLVRRSDG